MAEEKTLDTQALLEEYGKFATFMAESKELTALREEVRNHRIAPTPRDLLYREHSVAVYRYRRDKPPRLTTPMLVVPSLVNKPFVMDMLEGESFVGAMLERGLDVFIIEWGEPTPGQKRLSLDHYVNHYLGRAVRRIQRLTGAGGVTIAGYCLGGSLSLLHAACDGGERVRNLITMVTPVNFEDRGMLSWWSKKEHLNIDKVVDTYGNVPADFFSSSFPWLVPTASLVKARTVFERHQDRKFMESFMALDIWATENTPFPGEAYRQIIKLGYQENVLRNTGEWNLGERVARLADVKMPVLNLAAKYDHISPVESCTILGELVASRDTTTKTYDASHLGIALGKDIKGVPTTEYWDDIATWLRAHDR